MKYLFFTALMLIPCQTMAGGDFMTNVSKIDLNDHVRFGAEIGVTFSDDSRSICVSWSPSPIGDVRKIPVNFAVFDLKGKLISSSSITTNRVALLQEFPKLGCLDQGRVFVKDAVEWMFSVDFSQGLRLIGRTDSEVTAEMWCLRPKEEPVWNVRLTKCYISKVAKPLLEPQDKTVLVVKSGQEAVVLDRRTGAVIDTFTLGHIESDAEAVKRKKKFRLPHDDGDPALRFSAYKISQYGDAISNTGLLACGAFYDKRVRVIQLTRPYQMVFEANTDANPYLPRGGSWQVRHVEFLSNGKYLLAKYEFGGRGTMTILHPVEIFETTSWKVVWRSDDIEINAITLAPDGQTMAILKGTIIELQPFEPNSNFQKEVGYSKKRKVTVGRP